LSAKMSFMSSDVGAFYKTVIRHYRQHGRSHLPWRETKDVYRILVSEIMLQQTQVSRVIPYYHAFLKTFPTVHALAEAPLGEVLAVWQGLGYNRRAKMLHNAAKIIACNFHDRIPHSYDELVALPGVGEYTAKAIRVFAYDEREVMVETNIRSAFLHHFFKNKDKITDSSLKPLIEETLRQASSSREWYSALMDYGAHLKERYANPSRRSAHHVQQKPFRGSDREIRGAILKKVLNEPVSTRLLHTLPFAVPRVEKQLRALLGEGLVIARKDGRFSVSKR